MKPLIVLLSFLVVPFCLAEEKLLPPGHPSMSGAGAPAAMPAAPAQLSQKAEVVDVINVSQYTYLEVKQGDQTRWLAGPTSTAKKGDVVRFDDGMEMKDFHSKSLDRTFPSIFFVNRIEVGDNKK